MLRSTVASLLTASSLVLLIAGCGDMKNSDDNMSMHHDNSMMSSDRPMSQKDIVQTAMDPYMP